MVCQQREIVYFQEVTPVMNSCKYCQEFVVKSTVLLFSMRQLAREEGEQLLREGAMTLLEHSPVLRATAISAARFGW